MHLFVFPQRDLWLQSRLDSFHPFLFMAFTLFFFLLPSLPLYRLEVALPPANHNSVTSMRALPSVLPIQSGVLGSPTEFALLIDCFLGFSTGASAFLFPFV